MKHTPAPWMYPSMSNEVMTAPSGDLKICRVYPISENDNGEANARLIAAAPELLEALEDVAATRSMMMVQQPSEVQIKEILATFERVNAAIAKAKGQ